MIAISENVSRDPQHKNGSGHFKKTPVTSDVVQSVSFTSYPITLWESVIDNPQIKCGYF
jgi:hypothetical protein